MSLLEALCHNNINTIMPECGVTLPVSLLLVRESVLVNISIYCYREQVLTRLYESVRVVKRGTI